MGGRSPSNWRYIIIKKYKHRAEKFYNESKTVEEKMAWSKVIKWFNDILTRKRFITFSGAIGISEDIPKEEVK